MKSKVMLLALAVGVSGSMALAQERDREAGRDEPARDSARVDRDRLPERPPPAILERERLRAENARRRERDLDRRERLERLERLEREGPPPRRFERDALPPRDLPPPRLERDRPLRPLPDRAPFTERERELMSRDESPRLGPEARAWRGRALAARARALERPFRFCPHCGAELMPGPRPERLAAPPPRDEAPGPRVAPPPRPEGPPPPDPLRPAPRLREGSDLRPLPAPERRLEPPPPRDQPRPPAREREERSGERPASRDEGSRGSIE